MRIFQKREELGMYHTLVQELLLQDILLIKLVVQTFLHLYFFHKKSSWKFHLVLHFDSWLINMKQCILELMSIVPVVLIIWTGFQIKFYDRPDRPNRPDRLDFYPNNCDRPVAWIVSDPAIVHKVFPQSFEFTQFQTTEATGSIGAIIWKPGLRKLLKLRKSINNNPD